MLQKWLKTDFKKQNFSDKLCKTYKNNNFNVALMLGKGIGSFKANKNKCPLCEAIQFSPG